MRIAVVNWSARRTGGAESYLAGVIPAIANAGHDTSLWSEVDGPTDRAPIVAGAQGLDAAALRAWRPDVLYVHGVLDPSREEELLGIAPAVFFAHNYYGTCISGAKSWKTPVVRPCSRRFGPPCLLHFYPHRCGGLNPAAMVSGYLAQGRRLGLLRRYREVVTHSRHMRAEYLQHDLPAEHVHAIPFPVAAPAAPVAAARPLSSPIRLAWVGRMDLVKGGGVLLDTLPAVARSVGPVTLTFVGDGPERAGWERRARETATSDITITFAGWLDRASMDRIFDATDLLAVPSLWPEPFGLVGLEAGLRGVPSAGFAVGGIPDWLEPGMNGHLAPGDPPRADALAAAIVRCVSDSATHARLRLGAAEMAGRFTMERHLAALLPILERAA